MNKTIGVLSSTLSLIAVLLPTQNQPGAGLGDMLFLGPVRVWAAPAGPPPQEKKPQWKSREEYDAFQAMVNEKDPAKRVALGDAFLIKFGDTDFKDLAYTAQMGAY